MKKIDVVHATNSLEKYTRELGEEPLVLTEGGQAIAALVPISDEDLESIALYQSPRFQAMIERARAEHRHGASMSADDVRRELGVG
jgi:antitoxin (DNA-binding transcriptional repressor) of toxin-antitoxin stability system